eukprot:TRINITY_DN4058_c0_g1_i5.p1 TRINITY_DN4058_c0_g1~~TRINITY_DN4058_c0_g1_i5.p1  ORF type:complete len:698 (-),score=94.97 TRINITY_DN4058_c0_g1_i5:10-2103(-)
MDEFHGLDSATASSLQQGVENMHFFEWAAYKHQEIEAIDCVDCPCDPDYVTLHSLPRHVLESLMLHVFDMIRRKGGDVEDVLAPQWKERWRKWRSNCIQEMTPQKLAPSYTVIRDAVQVNIPQHEIVPGDVLHLVPGMMLPGDAVLLQSVGKEEVFLDLSLLQGVPLTQPRTTVPMPEPITHSTNSLFAGGTIVSGHGIGLITHVGKQTHLGKILQLATASCRASYPVAASLHQPFTPEIAGLQLNKRQATHYLADVTSIVIALDSLLQMEKLQVQKIACCGQIFSQMSSVPTKDSANTGRQHWLPFRLQPDTFRVSLFSTIDALDRLGVAAALCASEPFTADPVNQAVREWAQSLPFMQPIRQQFKLASHCFFPQLHLNGSLHMWRDELTGQPRKTGLLLLHGLAQKVFDTSNAVLTDHGVAPMSATQKLHFKQQQQNIGASRERVYGFAVMEVDLGVKSQPVVVDDELDFAYDGDIMELLKNADGLCFIGCCVVAVPPKGATGQIDTAFSSLRAMGIQVVLTSSDTTATVRSTMATLAPLHDTIWFEGHEISRELEDETSRLYKRLQSPGASCTILTLATAVQQRDVVLALGRDPSKVVCSIGSSLASLPAMLSAHISTHIVLRSESPSEIVVDDVALSDLPVQLADMVVLEGGLAVVVAALEQARTHASLLLPLQPQCRCSFTRPRSFGTCCEM